MRSRIFISYRRNDEPAFAGRLFDRLEQAFSADHLFMDVSTMPPGEDFPDALRSQVESCDVLLAIIGPGWLTANRLESPKDFVRIEIELGLALGKRVIPILVNNATMPNARELPETLIPLTQRHAVKLTHERFKAEAEALIEAIRKALQDADAARQQQEQKRLEAIAGFFTDSSLFSNSVFFPVQPDLSVWRRTIIDWRGIPLVTPYGFDQIGAGAKLKIIKRWKEKGAFFLKLTHPQKGTTIDYAIMCLFNPTHAAGDDAPPTWVFLQMAPGLESVGKTIPPWVVVERIDKNTLGTLTMTALRTEQDIITSIVQRQLGVPPHAITAAFDDMVPWTNPDFGDEGNIHRVCVRCFASIGTSSTCPNCGQRGYTVAPGVAV